MAECGGLCNSWLLLFDRNSCWSFAWLFHEITSAGQFSDTLYFCFLFFVFSMFYLNKNCYIYEILHGLGSVDWNVDGHVYSDCKPHCHNSRN